MRNIASKPTIPSSKAAKALGPNNVTARRVKEMAKRLRPLVSQAHGFPDESACLDWAAVALGFKNFEEAKAAGAGAERPLFSVEAGVRKGRVKSVFGVSKPEPWILSEKAMLGHELILGATGAGKTETVHSRELAVLRASPGMGLMHVDAHGDTSLAAKMFMMAEELGRAEDLRFLNFMCASRDVGADSGRKISHTFNPIEDFDAPMVERWLWLVFADELLSLPAAHSELVEAAAVAKALLRAVAFAHADMRRAGLADPGVAGLARCSGPGVLSDLSGSHVLGEHARAFVLRCEAMAPTAGTPSELSGISKNASFIRSAMEARLSSALGNWLASYGYILGPERGRDGAWVRAEISPFSAFDGEMVVVMLPALEKSPEELSLLGLMVSASALVAQTAMESVWPRRMSALLVFEEGGYYLPTTFEELLADASRAGVAVILTAQDLHAAVARCGKDLVSKACAIQALERCVGIKTFMKTECFDKTTSTFVFEALHSEGQRPSPADLQGLGPGRAWISGAGVAGEVATAYHGLKWPQGTELKFVKVPRRNLNAAEGF